MSATADIVAGDASGLAELQAALASAHVVVCSLESVAVTATAEKLTNPGYAEQSVLIAEGLPATQGRDGYFEPAFHVGIQPGHISEDGTMDFFDRELLKPVE